MTAMTTQIAANLPADFDLTELGKVALDSDHSRILQFADETCGGSPMWQNRKLAEAYQLLALAQISRRLTILFLDVREDLRVQLVIRAPVPFLPHPDGPLHI